MRRVLVCLAFVLSSVPLLAQTGQPTAWVTRIYDAKGLVGTPVTVPSAQAVCNQPAPTAIQADNPDRWFWNDPQNAGRKCMVVDTARFSALADGEYEGTVAALNADGSSVESARVPFTRRRPNPPAVPTGVVITR